MVFALLENRPPKVKRRSWRENKKFKAEVRKDRGAFRKGPVTENYRATSSGGPAGGRSSGGRAVSREQLKKVSKCRICHKRGHWAEDCRLNKTPANSEGPPKMSGFCYLGTFPDSSSSYFAVLTDYLPSEDEAASQKRYGSIEDLESSVIGGSLGTNHFEYEGKNHTAATLACPPLSFPVHWRREEDSQTSWSFLTIPSGMAILDIGATQDIIGATALLAMEDELSRSGLRVVQVPAPKSAPTGGAARVAKAVLAPISPGGVPGVVQFVVIEDNIPPLLSVGLLEHLGARIDLVSNNIHFHNIDVGMRMTNLPSGHRAIQLVQWAGGPFPVPPSAKEQFGLADDAFMKDAVSSAYIKGKCLGVQGSKYSHLKKDELSQFHIHSQPHVPHVSADTRDVACSCRSQELPQHVPVSMKQTLTRDDPLGSAETVLMGNRSTTASSPKFELCHRRNHGFSASTGSGDAQRPRGAMAADGGEHLPDVGDHPSGLPALGQSREQPEEHPLRETPLLDSQCSGAREVPAFRPTTSKSKSVRFMDGVSEVLGSPVLHRLPNLSQGQGQESSPDYDHGSSESVISGSSIIQCHGSPRGARPARAPDHFADHAERLPGDEQFHERLGSGPGADVVHDAAKSGISRTSRNCPLPECPGSQPDVGGGDHDGGDRDDGPGDARRSHVPGHRKLVPSTSSGEPQRERSSSTWPKWMTTSPITLASSLVAWAQLSTTFQERVLALGGGPQSWMVHCPLHSTSEVDPFEIKIPWLLEAGPTDTVLWHEVRDGQDRVMSRGPGPPSVNYEATAGQTKKWTCSRQHHFLLDTVDLRVPPQGLDADGEKQDCGPFWLVEAPLLSPQSVAAESDERNDPEAERAGRILLSLSRQQQRELSGSMVDYIELFEDSSVAAWCQQHGLRLASEHERFTTAASWKVEKKDHRSRFRKFLQEKRPAFLAIRLSGSSPSSENERQFAIETLKQSFALEAAQCQHAEGRLFYLEAGDDHEVWSSEKWQAMMRDSRMCQMSGIDHITVASNRPDIFLELSEQHFQNVSGPRRALRRSTDMSAESSTWEKMAAALRARGDFSHQSCLGLLRKVDWSSAPCSKCEKAVSRDSIIFGQYVRGNKTGITKATKAYQHVVRYLNDYLTYHGACAPRTSIAINRGNQGGRVSCHRDLHNHGRNQCIALGAFEGGKIWLADPSGSVVREVAPGVHAPGEVHRHRQRMLDFDARLYHEVEPWKGERWSIVAFQTRNAPSLCEQERARLREYGFEVYGYDPHMLNSKKRHHALFQCVRDLGAQGYQTPHALFSKMVTGPLFSSFDSFKQESAAPSTASFPVEVLREDGPPEGEEDAEDERIEGLPATSRAEPRITESQKQLIKKVHVNTGHPPADRLLRTLKAAGALPHVLRYVREEFKCDQCQIRAGPDHRRKAHCPRIVSFNRVVSMDVFYLPFQNVSVPVLNMVCSGTNFQIVQRIESHGGGTPSSAATWRAFLHSWVRYLGPPSLIINDGGNEFRGIFERGVEQLGTLQHVTAPESPWQNSRAERHGGWMKRRLRQEIESGQCALSNLDELDEFLSSLVAAKNRWFNQGGYTPVQLVFGELPRIPGELLAEDNGGLLPLNDAYHDPAGMDEIGAEFRRRNEIRERAKRLAMSENSKEAVQRAVKTSSTPMRQWTAGQWVYCFRRGKPGDTLHPTSRWVGPGLVVLSSRSLVWVAMRSRLWRCAPEQLRPAFPSEVLGRQLASDESLGELLRRVVSGRQVGAVDVAREGPPDERDHHCPVDRDHEGIQVSAGAPGGSSASRPSEAPQEVSPVPPGLLRVPSSSPPRPPGLEEVEHRNWQSPSQSSGFPSRRSSLQEPAQEPDSDPLPVVPEGETVNEATTSLDERTNEGTFPDSTTHARDPPDSSEERPNKTPRREESTRAPGTPVASLLDAIRQRRDEIHASSSTDVQPSESPPDLDGLSLFALDEQVRRWTLVASRSDEVDIKKLAAEEKALFDASDALEWKAILQTGAVRVATGAEAARLRGKYADRIVSSRMVRRRKPVEGIGSWKPKSRWCLHGHVDPDTGSLATYSPTPQTEGLMCFLQAGLNLNHSFAFCDVKNAFCQSDKLQRPNGPLFAEPCEGLNLPPGALIVINVPVYGLDDAPAAWRNTVVSFLVQQGFVKNLVEPCWYMRFNDKGVNEAQVLIEVDDFIVSSLPEISKQIEEMFKKRFHFGKWELNQADYAGRRVRVLEGEILVDQEKYITEQVHPVILAKGRRSAKDSPLEPEEFAAFRSAIYRVNWVAKETRPEVSGLASIMASKMVNATVEDVLTLNRSVNALRNSAARPLRIWRHDPREMAFVIVSDAGGIGAKHETTDHEGLPSDATQGAWLVLAAETLPVGGRRVRASPLAWRSSKLRRKVFSTFGGETQAMLQGIGEADWLQVMYRDAISHDIQLRDWRNSLSPHMLVMKGSYEMVTRQPQCAVTDAKSLFDCLLKEHPQGRQDRKSSLELAIIVKDLQETGSYVRWVPHQKMLADTMTKPDPLRANGALEQFIKHGILSLVDVSAELQARATDPRYRRRSHSASAARLLREYQDNALAFWSTLIGGCCQDSHVVCVKHSQSVDQKNQ